MNKTSKTLLIHLFCLTMVSATSVHGMEDGDIRVIHRLETGPACKLVIYVDYSNPHGALWACCRNTEVKSYGLGRMLKAPKGEDGKHLFYEEKCSTEEARNRFLQFEALYFKRVKTLLKHPNSRSLALK